MSGILRSTSPATIPTTINLELAMQNDVELHARATTWRARSAEELAQLSAEDHILNAVAAFHFKSDLSSNDYRSIRQGLEIAKLAATDSYSQSLIELYSILPVVPFGHGMFFAPDAALLVDLKRSGRTELLEPDKFYRPETKELGEKLRTLLQDLPSDAELLDTSKKFADFKPSPLFEAIFAREGAPPELEKRARVALAQIISEMKTEISILNANSKIGMSHVEVLATLHRYLKEKFKVTDAAQPSIVAGLTTKTFDCDVYTLVMCEFGRQTKMSIDAAYIIDPTKPTGIQHTAPIFVVRQNGQLRYIAFETREPIEKLPDGGERRLYKSFAEIRDRVNKLANEEIFGPKTILCILTDEVKCKLLPPYGATTSCVDLSSKDVKVIWREPAEQVTK